MTPAERARFGYRDAHGTGRTRRMCSRKRWAEFRRSRLNTLVMRLRTLAKTRRPGLTLSAAVYPDPSEARDGTAAGLADVARPPADRRGLPDGLHAGRDGVRQADRVGAAAWRADCRSGPASARIACPRLRQSKTSKRPAGSAPTASCSSPTTASRARRTATDYLVVGRPRGLHLGALSARRRSAGADCPHTRSRADALPRLARHCRLHGRHRRASAPGSHATRLTSASTSSAAGPCRGGPSLGRSSRRKTSTVTFISVPGYAFGGDFTFLQLAAGYLIGRVVISVLFIPAYFRGELLTVYQLLGSTVWRQDEAARLRAVPRHAIAFRRVPPLRDRPGARARSSAACRRSPSSIVSVLVDRGRQPSPTPISAE